MIRVSLFSLLLFSTFVLSAQTLSAQTLSAQARIDAGLAFGLQPYENPGESPRGLPSADLLVRGDALGAHLAVEYTDLLQIGALVAVHLDAVYRRGDQYFFLAGAGPTLINTGSADNNGANVVTWNAELEAGRAFRRAEVFLRLRYYDYDGIERFRERDASPNGPAIYAGVRFALRR